MPGETESALLVYLRQAPSSFLATDQFEFAHRLR